MQFSMPTTTPLQNCTLLLLFTQVGSLTKYRLSLLHVPVPESTSPIMSFVALQQTEVILSTGQCPGSGFACIAQA